MAPTIFKTGLVFLAQLQLTWGMVILPRSSVTCDYKTAAASGDTCSSFAAEWGLTEETFGSINPGITCPDLVSGQDYCVVGTVTSTGPTTTASSTLTTSTVITSTVTSSTSSSTSSSSAPYQPQQTGTAATCDQYHLVGQGDSCSAIESQYDISLTEFLAWNPSLNSDCTNLLVGYYYCVDIPGATKVATTTTVPATTAPADGITTPSPIQTGMTATCNKFDLVQSGDTCAVIANKYNIPLASFYDWNPAVGSSCAHLDVGDYVCVDIIGYTATTSTTSSGNGIPTPTPFEPGMVNNCTTFYFVSSGDTCASIASSKGVTVAQITQWNPKVGTGCTDLWLHEYICVGV
ncbi:hypothetical protein N7539_000633 [Penicillium diatomitis]|uniref:LysM domain-containing protein n=1 Tax=Penicillium diatomitis TaxID=2819901 RepID=A0A9X0C2E3_9EURO|nr:uncharacterized protein N7539_000633 [Penicillium diatomitis]KAJ5495517.1 hypothetical protein N7539_000633 [Penicillium diatomitis]